MNIIKLAFPSDPKPVLRVKRSECGRVWRIVQPNGYSMISRRTKRAAVALAQRDFPGYEVRVEE